MHNELFNQNHPSGTSPPDVPPGYAEWITSALIAHTLRVWQRFYPDPLTAEDAAEILATAGRLFDACAPTKRPTP